MNVPKRSIAVLGTTAAITAAGITAAQAAPIGGFAPAAHTSTVRVAQVHVWGKSLLNLEVHKGRFGNTGEARARATTVLLAYYPGSVMRGATIHSKLYGTVTVLVRG